jgi:hypothetical protein
MLGFQLIIITVLCAIGSFILYRIWMHEVTSGNEPHCVTKGDMYCLHLYWCDAEIALYPEEYESEMKRLKNDTNQDQ